MLFSKLRPVSFGLLALLLMNVVAAPDGQAAERPPNFVLIFVDDMGYGDLSCFRGLGVPPGGDRPRADAHYPPTPHIDRLAEQGIRLTQFYVAAPVCSASRVAVMTGQYPARHLINTFLSSRESNRAKGMRDFLDPRAPTIARTFQQAGYATAHVGKWHLGGGRDVDDAPLPQAYGFDESLTQFEGLGDRLLPPGGLSQQSAKLGQGEVTWVEKHEMTGRYVDRAVDFITRNKDRPFYLHLWLNDVHDVHAPAPGSAEAFKELTANPFEQSFFAVLTEMDRQVGRLVDQIDKLGLGEETLIVLTSDNGPTAWPSYYKQGQDPPGSTAGFRGRKWSLYEGGVRMPCIARWTGHIPAGTINSKSIVSTIDLLPTFAAIAGIDLTKSLKLQHIPSTPSSYFDGLDMSQAVLNHAPVRTRPLFWEYGRDETYLQPGLPLDDSPSLAIRDGQWKLLVNVDGSRLELYDLSEPANEFQNVAGQHVELAARLKEQLLTWRRSLPALDPQEESLQRLISRSTGRAEYKYKAGDVVPAASAPAIVSAPFSIVAEVVPDGTDGVIVAQGGSQTGYALYIQDGRLKFTANVRGQRTTFETDAPAVGQPVTIGAALLGDGAMRMRVGQDLPQVVMAPSIIPNPPGDGLEVGRDIKSPVGDYKAPFAWTGEIKSVTISVGETVPAGPPPTLVTRFAAGVNSHAPLPEYPRPQLTRPAWLNLNGYWDYAIRPHGGMEAPEKWDGRIIVPFCPESILSGVRQTVTEKQRLWYRRMVRLPAEWPADHRVLLHFGAVDWETTVWVNGRELATHRGGYDPFSIDITPALHADRAQDNEVVVAVWDPTDTGSQPRGKQVRDPRGIWYTPVTGIWQTVWLEPVPVKFIGGLKLTPRYDANELLVEAQVDGGPEGYAFEIIVQPAGSQDDALRVTWTGGAEQPATIPLSWGRDHAWTPDNPQLIDVTVRLLDCAVGQKVDEVQSYFGMRKIEIGRATDGHLRMLLNGSPLFQFGPLDQGWWPDGLYTAPTDEALRYDIEVTKQLGFNMARKHVKVEPARWYHWCDKLGLLVWQDMPSGMLSGTNQFVKSGQPDGTFSPAEQQQFKTELQALIDTHYNAPCIVVWCPFNEGWGQHQTNDVLRWVKEYDPTRLVDGPSGWEDRGFGDLKDMHKYPGPDMFPTMSDRVSVLGEYGGLGLPIAGHVWVNTNNWGYRTYMSRDELKSNYEQLTRRLPELIAKGLAAAVYTQTTDVEIEVSGLMTYDRQIIKLDPEWMAELHRAVYEPPAEVKPDPAVPAADASR